MSIVHCPLSIGKMIKEDNLNKVYEKNRVPLVSILLAVYNPNYSWFKEQLSSLNNQSYNNLELIIYDDCPEHPLDEEVIEKYIDNFSYKIIKGKENYGSNKAFEELTKIGDGEFLAYCDQDDIWESNKIDVLVKLIKEEKANLAYSDMKVIDKNGNIIANTLIESKPRLDYIYGENLFSKFFFKNCVSGCCMLIDSKIAKSAVPFSKYIVHDQWLCIIASLNGRIAFTNETLVKYRIHGNNQTSSLKGVNNKKDYYNLRVKILEDRLNELKKFIDEKNIDLNEIKEFCYARINKNIFKILKYRYLCKKEAYFEVIIKYIPECIFIGILKKLKV